MVYCAKSNLSDGSSGYGLNNRPLPQYKVQNSIVQTRSIMIVCYLINVTAFYVFLKLTLTMYT